MILVDSSVWIDYFRGAKSLQVEVLDGSLDSSPLAIGDLILAEVLQGCTRDAEFEHVRRTLSSLTMIEIAGPTIAVQAARHFRALRAQGVTVRKTIDTLIATRCIHDDISLLYSDRDFDPFVKHLGLSSACANT